MSIRTNDQGSHLATALRGAPWRGVLADAEADEQRGKELKALMRLLPTLTKSQWRDASDVVRASTVRVDDMLKAAHHAGAKLGLTMPMEDASFAAWDAAPSTVRGQATSGARAASWAATAIIVKGELPQLFFDAFTAPMRAAGVDFDNLVQPSPDSESHA